MLSSLSNVAAQDEDNPQPVAYGETVEGEIDNDEFAQYYTFSAVEDEVVLIEMYGEFDTRLELLDDDGDLETENDDFVGLNSVILFQIPADGEYTIVATRYGGEDGGGEGQYALSVNQLQSVEIGGTYETQIAASGVQIESLASSFLVLQPEEDTVVRFTYQASELDDELFGAISLAQLTEDQPFSPFNALVRFDPTIPLAEMSFALELNDGDTYIFWVSRASYAFAFEGDPIDVTVTVEPVG
jgi:hypothetical protein